MPHPTHRYRVLSALVALALGACSSDTRPSTVAATRSTAPPLASAGPATPPSSATEANGSVTVLAAASLTEAFTSLQTGLKGSTPTLSITYSFGGSGALVTQIRQGAPADVVATADMASMQTLVDAELVDQPRTFARNKLEILVAPGNPLGIGTLSDLARGNAEVVLCDDTVPAGKYAAESLKKAGVTVDPVSREPDVKAAVARVTSGEADATIVYVTDVNAAGSKGQGVEIPEALNVTAGYPIAVVSATAHRSAAWAFVLAVIGSHGQEALQQKGFLPPR